MRSIIYNLLNQLSNYINGNKSLRVLAYHTVPEKITFENQLLFLKENYNLISIYDLQKVLFSNSALPDNSVLISFDDGDVSVYENGFPVLKKLAIPSILFVITGLIDTQKTFWCRWVEKVFEDEGKSYSEARAKVNYLKKIPEEERRSYLEKIPEVGSQQLSSKQIKELNGSGMFIGNHTHTHPMINNCDADQIIEEMSNARSKFEKLQLDQNFSIFAYPNGNWDPESERILLEEGIEMAFLFDHQVNNDVSKINPMRISRIRVNADDDFSEFKVKVSGLHSKILNLRQIIGF